MRKTQTEQVRDYIEEYGSISQAEAVTELGCYRLSARIKDLKDMGVPIIRKMESKRNRYGYPVSFARYSIDGHSD